MFSVIFEVRPRAGQWDAYLGHARMLRPELEGIEGFVDNVRYRSLTREGWLLSLSGWRDEKAVVRWRVRVRHHEVQEKGRGEVLEDYHLRVGEVMADSVVPPGQVLREQRLDETAVGAGWVVTLVDGRVAAGEDAAGVAARLGLVEGAAGLVGWDVFEAVLSPGDAVLLMTWRDRGAAEGVEGGGGRVRHVRVVRDYGMFDRREAPQYYPDVPGRATLHG